LAKIRNAALERSQFFPRFTLAHFEERLTDKRACLANAGSFAERLQDFVVESDGRPHASFIASFDAKVNATSHLHPVPEKALMRDAQVG
jgi:hypothetical protein